MGYRVPQHASHCELWSSKSLYALTSSGTSYYVAARKSLTVHCHVTRITRAIVIKQSYFHSLATPRPLFIRARSFNHQQDAVFNLAACAESHFHCKIHQWEVIGASLHRIRFVCRIYGITRWGDGEKEKEKGGKEGNAAAICV